MALEVEIVLEYADVAPGDVWKMLLSKFPETSSQKVKLDDREVNADKVAGVIERSKRPSFLVKLPEGEIECGQVGSAQLELIFLQGVVKDPADAKKWIDPFLKSPQFIMARLYDYDFHYWQNADDPFQYSSAGRSMSGLPMRSNGLPAPLEQMVVDTSRNPGRRVFRDDYIEAIGSHMWIGPVFWRRVGGSPERIEAESWIKARRLNSDVLEIEAYSEPFTSAEGEEALIQNKLRSILFPIEPLNDPQRDVRRTAEEGHSPSIELRCCEDVFDEVDGAFGSSFSCDAIVEVAQRLRRPVEYIDSTGYACKIFGALTSSDSQSFLYVEVRAKQFGPRFDISVKIHFHDTSGRERSVDIETHNPFFGCIVHSFKWIDGRAILIYSEKHHTYICTFGNSWPPRFVTIDELWDFKDGVVAYIHGADC